LIGERNLLPYIQIACEWTSIIFESLPAARCLPLIG
jgi:hypothetical protein